MLGGLQGGVNGGLLKGLNLLNSQRRDGQNHDFLQAPVQEFGNEDFTDTEGVRYDLNQGLFSKEEQI